MPMFVRITCEYMCVCVCVCVCVCLFIYGRVIVQRGRHVCCIHVSGWIGMLDDSICKCTCIQVPKGLH